MLGAGRNVPMLECTKCECNDGSMQCKKQDPDQICPPLPCPPEQQIVVPEKCCKVCPGTDYCATQRNQCHPNATCVNLQTTFTCQCNEGFTGDGLNSCEDVDECLLGRHHCARNTVCLNLEGGYDCECVQGFKKLNRFQCEDADECADGSHKCHKHATCTNTKGSYLCSCNQNYQGDGFHCSPVCNRTCENGGLCIAPNVCSCRSGWTGGHCETDIDECLLNSTSNNNSNLNNNTNLHPPCPQNAVCINKPGWHMCQCKEGYQLVLNEFKEGNCQDVNECEEEESPCGEGLVCHNTQGSYECRCPKDQCGSGCMDKGTLHPLGSQWISEDCQVCSCLSPGAVSCLSPDPSDFCSQQCSLLESNNDNDNLIHHHQCCSTCNATLHYQSESLHQRKLKSCRHELYPELEYQSGETWYSNCQTCECLDGETDCWSIDCPPANCHNAYLQPGDCCYRCPGGEQAPSSSLKGGDKCTHWHRNGTFSECHLLEETIQSGTRVTLPHTNCISCKCQDGELCCSYDYDCVAHQHNNENLRRNGEDGTEGNKALTLRKSRTTGESRSRGL